MTSIHPARSAVSIGLALSVTVAASLLFSGCGSSGDSSAPAPEVVAPSPGPNPTPVTAGFTLEALNTKAVIFQGNSASVEIQAKRLGGFDGAIDVSFSGLPAGVSASPARIGVGSDRVTVTLSAAGSAAHSLPTTVAVDGAATQVPAAKTAMTVTVRGVAGAVDTSFGSAGHAVAAVGPSDDYAQAMVVQSDGKIVVAGWGAGTQGTVMQLVRWQRDGAMDTSFGNGGRVLLDLGAGTEAAHAVALQADGKLLVAGSVDEVGKGKSVLLVRLNADGSLDSSFGQGGQVVGALGGGSSEAFAIAVQADGKIVLGGHAARAAATTTTGLDFALLRFNSNGTPDTRFGQGGVVVDALRPGTQRDSVYALALQVVNGETMIVAAGGEADFVVQRYRADGTRDATFGGGSSRVGMFGSNIGAARALTVTADNKIVVVGHVNEDVAVVRLLADGAFDTSFSQDGRVITPLSSGNWDEAHAVAVQADGKIVVGGWVYSGNSSSGDHAVLRYAADGSLDSGFGNAGITITPVSGSRIDEGRALQLQVDERVPTVRSVLAGVASNSNRDFAVTRFWH
jgi:uncharacterized delta-60 repeat protein